MYVKIIRMSVAALAIMAAGCASHTGSAEQGSFSAAASATGQSSRFILDAYLRPNVSADQVVTLQQHVIINISGVSYTQYWPGGPIVIGARTQRDLKPIEAVLAGNPLILRITEGPTPTPPAKERAQG